MSSQACVRKLYNADCFQLSASVLRNSMTPDQIFKTFHDARMTAAALPGYPGGAVPATLPQAYAIQQASIAAWPDRVAGWKVAAIQPQWRDAYPDERLCGPVFSKSLVVA